MTPADLALVVGATARLTRLVTSDDLGKWWVQDPAYQAAQRHVDRTGYPPRWDRYRDGLTCPWCVGYWIGLATLTSGAWAIRHGGRTATAWRLLAGSLTLNLVTAPAVARLSEGSDDHDSDTDPT